MPYLPVVSKNQKREIPMPSTPSPNSSAPTSISQLINHLESKTMTTLNPFEQNYVIPKASDNYLRLQPNSTITLRMLENPITGWEWWKDEGGGKKTPIRVQEREDVPPGNDPRHFWAVPVWNLTESRIQVWTIKQRGIMEKILTLSKNKAWGSPVGNNGYNLCVERIGDGLMTKWTVTPEPKSAVPLEAVKAFAEVALDMSAFYSGDDPFNPPVKEAASSGEKDSFLNSL
jgi:hypothetical protein